MNNEEYLANMSPEQRRQSRIEGTVGILKLIADQVEKGKIIVNADTLNDNGKTFSFEYEEAVKTGFVSGCSCV